MRRDARLDVLADQLHSAAIQLLRRVRAEDRASGLTPARLSALSVLVFGGPCQVGELAAAEQVSAPTMSALVSALEADGLIRRRRDRGDRRAVILEATAAGRRLMRRGRARRVRALRQLLEPFDRSERALLERAVTLLQSALGGQAGGLPARAPGVRRREV
ncbi:MAG: MarR family winged helix-turn-helix transcriptional regulator [Longimicrobiales bacterium]